MEVSDLPDKEFKMTVTKILTKVRRTMHEQSENFINKDRKYKKVPQIEITELKNTITELKCSIKGFNCRLDDVEERISQLKDRAVEFIQSEKPKKIKKKKKKKQRLFKELMGQHQVDSH